MKISVFGSGGREYVLARMLSLCPGVTEVVCAPGNGGTSGLANCRNVNIPVTDIPALIALAREERFDLTVVGPEAPLCAGIVDAWPKDLLIWGPNQHAARLEGSKIFARETMGVHNVPQPEWKAFDSVTAAEEWLMLQPEDKPWVVKADGLAAGKGVLMCKNRAEAIEAVGKMADFEEAGKYFIIEECLVGTEASLFLLCGKAGQIIPLETAKDFKRAGNGDTGPNTGGMGAFSPADYLTPEMIADIIEKLRPLIAEVGFTGFLYVGLMLTAEGWMVLEFNVRMGDPESQVVFPRLESNLANVLYVLAGGDTYLEPLVWSEDSAVTVVMTAGGYPDKYRKGDVITGLEAAEEVPNVIVMHAGTKTEDGQIMTNGGRVLNVTALGPTLEEARALAYQAVGLIDWDDVAYRHDIAE